MARFLDNYQIDWSAMTQQNYEKMVSGNKSNITMTLPIKMNGEETDEYRLCVQTKHNHYESVQLVAEVKTQCNRNFWALEDFKFSKYSPNEYDMLLSVDGVISVFNALPTSFQEFKDEVNEHFQDEFGMPQFIKQLKDLAKCGNEDEMREFFWYYTSQVPILQNVNIDEFKGFFVNGDAPARSFAASRGWETETLVNDNEYFVRYTLAEYGYCLDKLITDKSEDVAACAARSMMFSFNHGFIDHIDEDVFLNSPHERVREVAAKNGIGLETLINDESDTVRAAAERELTARGDSSKPMLNKNQTLDWSKLPESTYYNLLSDTSVLASDIFIPIVENGEAVKDVKAQLSCLKGGHTHGVVIMKVVDNHHNELPEKLDKNMPKGVIGRFDDTQLGTYEGFIETIDDNFKAFVQKTIQKNRSAVEHC